jgi:hypothetical protein
VGFIFMTKDTEDDIVRQLKSGILKREIVVLTGLSIATIKRIQKKHGILVDEQTKKQHTSAASKLKWQDPKFRDTFNKSLLEVRQTEDYKSKMSKSISDKWADGSDYRSKCHGAILIRAVDPEYGKQVSNRRRKEIRGVCLTGGSLLNTHPDIAIEWSGDNLFHPNEITSGSDYRANWICKNNPLHTWTTTVRSRCYIGHPSGCPRCAHLSSGDEEILFDFVRQFRSDVQCNVRGLLVNKLLEIDIYIPSLKLGIEICGEYWHREGNDPKINVRRHHEKYLQAKAAGIRLLTIFRSELYDRTNAVEGYLLSILGVKNTDVIFARKCKIKEVSKIESDIFLNKYHIQGAGRYIYSYGLYYYNNLVAVMTFGREIDNNFVLSRFCTSNTRVPGGASKLLKYFVNEIKPNKIISFSDNRWSGGNLYRVLGFAEGGEVKPSYWYFNLDGPVVLEHKFKYRKDAISARFGALLENETEYEAMLRFGYDRIWDCGKRKWEIKFNV